MTTAIKGSALARWLTLTVALAGSALIFNQAQAASMDQCRTKFDALEAAFPSGITDTWIEILQEELDKINAMNDADSLTAGMDAAIAEYDDYQRDPDPDGDGMAFDPKIIDAKTMLSICLYTARAEEIAPSAEPTEDAADAADLPDEEGESEDLTSPPKPITNQAEWFADINYPITALEEGRSGVVRYDVTVAADGSVAGCQASGPLNSADLELATCSAVLAHARFEPGTDNAGRPVVSEISGTMRWSLE